MKTGSLQPEGFDPAREGTASGASAILEWADLSPGAPGAGQDMLAKARVFAEPLLATQRFDTGEGALSHADGVVQILRGIGAPPGLQAAAYLVYASEYLTPPDEVIARACGEAEAQLVGATRRLVQVQRSARDALG
ncbi:MAG TPA: HD domain-containing protein, partial [Aquabacterium sp.]|nr:HD domain-containing protein [Aquabacterium sp.]